MKSSLKETQLHFRWKNKNVDRVKEVCKNQNIPLVYFIRFLLDKYIELRQVHDDTTLKEIFGYDFYLKFFKGVIFDDE